MRNGYSNVFAFINFREFLRDYYENRSKVDKSFTKTAMCKKLGLPNSRSYFGEIMSGKVALSNIKMELIIKIFELKGDEAQYFRCLVQYNQSCIKEEREFYFDNLISLNKTPKKLIDPDAYAYFKDWAPSTIRAALDVFDIKNNYKTLGEKIVPSISTKRVQAAIQLLDKLKFIKRNKNGCWKPTDKMIQTKSYMEDELIKKYQAECLEIAAKAIWRNSSKPKNISCDTMSISKGTYLKIEKKLQKFKSEFKSIVHKDEEPASDVYQLCIQLYPQTE